MKTHEPIALLQQVPQLTLFGLKWQRPSKIITITEDNAHRPYLHILVNHTYLTPIDDYCTNS